MSSKDPNYKEFKTRDSLIIKRFVNSTILVENHVRKPFKYSNHGHEIAYFMFTDNCSYRERMGSVTHHHQPKTIIWRPKGISHADEVRDPDRRFFSIYVRDKCLNEFSQFAKIPAEFSERNSFLVFLAIRIQKEFRNWEECSTPIAEGLVLELLGHASKEQSKIEKHCPKWMTYIIDKLDSEFREKHTNASLAAEVGLHPVHLATAFRKFQNLTVGEYLKRKRINYSMQLLSENELSLSEIAFDSGFSDQGHFTRVFKAVTGITPGAFRNSL
ncbi:MAG: AraC family transcriptional regulator [Acidobacteria bacterium]|nr:MAG: AraC family transcriptional regulator [Acidobacteriota bacterium]REK01523.1 MAG: AraC family transcriptional regulator [Acidobacteriota bacterium]REK14479.1 MAG: AraC family transcriptional regulator [Acidobacteriota bacterium]REK45194.1 MAG: AraC family transcriptional regulator [Acidobacteriota bacterium]